jgi:hypothetical protein
MALVDINNTNTDVYPEFVAHAYAVDALRR